MTGYSSPTPDRVQAALRRLTNYHLRRAFYGGLKNPLWVKPLADVGAFDSPPEPEIGSDGLVRETYWPEAGYLSDMADLVPSEVVDVLVSFVDSSNPWVRRVVFSVGARVPPDVAARLKPVVDAWQKGGYGWRTDPRDLVSFAVNLLHGTRPKLGISFANKLFRPTRKNGPDGDPVTELKSHWYSRELPRITRALGDNALRTILPWLVLYEEQQRSIGEDFDHSGFGRPSIAQRGDGYDETQDALIDAVRDSAIEQLERDPERTWKVLNRNPILIVRRISLFAVAEVLERRIASAGNVASLIPIGGELMLDVGSRAHDAIPEFTRLLRALATASPSELDQLAGVLAAGHLSATETERVTRHMRERGESDEEIQEQIARWDKDWRHLVLAGVGRDILPTALQSTLDSLDAEDGAVADSLSPPYQIYSWVGPNSPISQEQMSALAPAELVAQMEGWHQAGDRWGPEPSHEGQARLLEAVVTGNPLALQGEQELTRRLRPTYLRAVLNGWEGALKSDLDLPWEQVLSLASDVLSHPDESEFPVEGGRFDDPDFAETKKVAISLLSRLASKNSAEKVPEEHLNRLADLLLAATADDAAWREYFASGGREDSGWDPLMISLNWKWPILLRGIVNLVGLGPTRPWHIRSLEALEQQLSLEDPRGASRAVLGEGLGRLFNHAREWLTEHLATCFGTRTTIDRNQQVALTTAITRHYYHPDLYQLMSDPMIAALHRDGQVVVGWRNNVSPQQRIGHWVIEAIIRGDIASQDRLRSEFYERADPDVRGDAIGHIAWSFMHAEVVDEAIRARLAGLWDERVTHVKAHSEDRAELKGFYWLIRSDKFPASWWLPRLVEALELDGGLETNGMIGEQLAAAADEFPRAALDALTMLLGHEEASVRDDYDLRVHSLAPVIAAALRTSDERLQADARGLMNLMGARGEIDLERRVLAVLATEPASSEGLSL